jgi:hypothetical protein
MSFNKSLDTNRRPALALKADRELGSAVDDRVCLSGNSRSASRSPRQAFAATNAPSETSIAIHRPALAHRYANGRQVIEHASLRVLGHRNHIRPASLPSASTKAKPTSPRQPPETTLHRRPGGLTRPLMNPPCSSPKLSRSQITTNWVDIKIFTLTC